VLVLQTTPPPPPQQQQQDLALALALELALILSLALALVLVLVLVLVLAPPHRRQSDTTITNTINSNNLCRVHHNFPYDPFAPKHPRTLSVHPSTVIPYSASSTRLPLERRQFIWPLLLLLLRAQFALHQPRHPFRVPTTVS
jgi:uncharacterized protein (DUF58 family)